MINLTQELEGYAPINFKDVEKGAGDIPDNVKNSIVLYNKALESLKSGSEDIAIIELKKAISMNPDFLQAMNLLGICYSYIKDYAKAAEIFQKVVDAEKNGVKALNYLKLLEAGDDMTLPKPKARKKSKPNMSVAKSETKPEGDLSFLDAFKLRGKFDLFKYLAGMVIGVLLMVLIGLPGGPGGDGNAGSRDEAEREQKLLSEKLADYELKYGELEDKYKNLQKDLETANSSIDYYKLLIKLFEAEGMASKKDYTGAADVLVLIKDADFKGEEKARFEKLYNDVMPAAANAAFQEGFRLYNSGQYQEAIDKLSKVQVYKQDFKNMDRVIYYIGRSYMALNDSRNALAAFQKVTSDYPESAFARYARARIRELTQVP